MRCKFRFVVVLLAGAGLFLGSCESMRQADCRCRAISKEESAQGFVPLFNGRDLAGWTGGDREHFFYVEDAKIVCPKNDNSGRGYYGNLYTEKEYADFTLRFEFRLTPGANNGIGIRTPLDNTVDMVYAGTEIQILDDSSEGRSPDKKVEPYQYHGSIYGVVAAKRGHLKPVGQWNHQEIIAKGSQITVILNGTTIVDADVIEASKNGTLDADSPWRKGREHTGLNRKSGHIALLAHASDVEFRNIRIKPLRQ